MPEAVGRKFSAKSSSTSNADVSSEIYESFKNTSFYRTPPVAACELLEVVR